MLVSLKLLVACYNINSYEEYHNYKEHVMMAISLLADEGLAVITKWIGAVQMWLKDF